ncbi:peptide/nickel transport system ATP-binding protein [Microbacterium resistens]|uniref:Peptide/nickel transport system ATP-binding protein n=1 Tax=Microbacterium resistens TaxID=156977 RepID=A0ABU1SFM3_9MICO|nr:ABC transporter ATP-binding protein [Microbacterium resistens]MDR6868408.1 peptide/nickel transport system ATP-binding protein [Microbacterium resistens]
MTESEGLWVEGQRVEGLRVEGLRVRVAGRTVVDGVSFDAAPGECVAIVGESGAGKTLTARALLGLLPEGAESDADTLDIAGVDARGLPERGWRALRGARIGLVSQDALVSLDPLRRVGAEVAEPLEIHRRQGRAARSERVRELLAAVAVSEPARRARQYPHELSGGLRQRALIASALAASPAVLIADEPTTALDATVQLRVLDLLRSIADRGTALVLVSHDIGAVRRIADRVVVMKDGAVVEQGPTERVLTAPAYAYTAELVRAGSIVPQADAGADASAGAGDGAGDVVLRAIGVGKSFDRPILRDASFVLRAGATLGVVGESGSGKTTLARILVGVETPDEGRVERGAEKRSVQLVHQNPLGAFDPRWTIGRSLREALAAGGVPRRDRAEQVLALLAEVGLDPELARRRPIQLSGGQRQRAAIARALAADPRILVLDEPVSALDATVRRRILTLLVRLQQERGLTMVLVSHDLGVVAAVADEVLVLRDGEVVEQGTVREVFSAPRHPFTQELIAAATGGGAGSAPSVADIDPGRGGEDAGEQLDLP